MLRSHLTAPWFTSSVNRIRVYSTALPRSAMTVDLGRAVWCALPWPSLAPDDGKGCSLLDGRVHGLPTVHGFRAYAVPFGWMTVSQQYPVVPAALLYRANHDR